MDGMYKEVGKGEGTGGWVGIRKWDKGTVRTHTTVVYVQSVTPTVTIQRIGQDSR